MFTLVPSSVTTSPFTVTTPAWIRVSASRREHTPELAMNLLRRTTSFMGVSYCSAPSLPFTTGLRSIILVIPSKESLLNSFFEPGFGAFFRLGAAGFPGVAFLYSRRGLSLP